VIVRPMVVLFVVLSVCGFSLATESDLWSTIADVEDPVQPGETVTYEVELGNHGPDEPVSPFVNVELPAGVPAAPAVLTQEQWDTLEASATSTLGEPALYLASTCENLLWQLPLDGLLPADAAGTFSYELTMAESRPATPVVRIDSPASIAGELRFGRGTCWDCDLMACFGPRLSTLSPITTELVMVDDGTSAGNEGCNPSPSGAYAGKIAFVYRGTCEFGYKALFAEQSGAVATIIADNNDPRLGPDDVLDLPFDDLVTTPVAFISYNNGARVETAMAEGPVVVTMGGIEQDSVTTRTHAWENTSTSTDTDHSNDSDWEDTLVNYAGVVAPVASFTFNPVQPSSGETIQFTDTSSNDPQWWQWDFGDGVGSSGDQHPSYSYASSGSYTVTLIAGNIAGSDSTSGQVTVTAASFRSLIPAAAYSEGMGWSFFVTDAEVVNAGGEAMSFTLEWLPRDTDNSEPLGSESFSLEPGHQRRFANVLDEVFGLEVGALGALAVVADSDAALIMSRTFNLADEGTFGQAIPGVSESELIPTGVRRRIILMTETDGYRSNLGLANGCDQAITVMVELHDQSGAVLETRSVDLPPYGNTQLNRLFRDYAPVATGYVDVWSDTEGAAFTCYGSVLDWQTSDPTTVLPQ
jgi:PKD repeat protein